jgi:hypothetical protein
MTKKKPTEEELHKLLVATLRGDSHQHFALIRGIDETGFAGEGDQTPAIVLLVQAHQEWMISTLKDNVVTLHWNDHDDHALAGVIPVVMPDAKKRFDTYRLKFPIREGDPALRLN